MKKKQDDNNTLSDNPEHFVRKIANSAVEGSELIKALSQSNAETQYPANWFR
jgi:hypothetical protein